jgi:hypothetical protein
MILFAIVLVIALTGKIQREGPEETQKLQQNMGNAGQMEQLKDTRADFKTLSSPPYQIIITGKLDRRGESGELYQAIVDPIFVVPTIGETTQEDPVEDTKFSVELLRKDQIIKSLPIQPKICMSLAEQEETCTQYDTTQGYFFVTTKDLPKYPDTIVIKHGDQTIFTKQQNLANPVVEITNERYENGKIVITWDRHTKEAMSFAAIASDDNFESGKLIFEEYANLDDTFIFSKGRFMLNTEGVLDKKGSVRLFISDGVKTLMYESKEFIFQTQIST